MKPECNLFDNFDLIVNPCGEPIGVSILEAG